MKLHLGAGKKLLDGWENIDAPGSGAPVEMDVRHLTYRDDSADEIMAIHVVEHIAIADVGAMFDEWFRVLRPGGRVVIEVPCREHVFSVIASGMKDQRTHDAVMCALYGDPGTHRTVADVHRWLWSKAEMAMLLADAGFADITVGKAQYHVPARDMRVEAIKPQRIIVAS